MNAGLSNQFKKYCCKNNIKSEVLFVNKTRKPKCVLINWDPDFATLSAKKKI